MENIIDMTRKSKSILKRLRNAQVESIIKQITVLKLIILQKNIALWILLLFSILSLNSCDLSNKRFSLGITPAGLPITLIIDNQGRPSINISGNIKLPFATFSIGIDDYIQSNCTYVELYNRKENKKFVFELAKDNTSFIAETSGKTKVEVIKKQFSTIVKIDSDEISRHLYVGPEPDAKPSFPEHPWRYFVVTKSFNSNIDWSIKSVGDFFADILFGIVWLFTIFIDLIIIIISFLIRFIFWIFILLAYAVGLY